jgi:hypothetical protein
LSSLIGDAINGNSLEIEHEENLTNHQKANRLIDILQLIVEVYYDFLKSVCFQPLFMYERKNEEP